MNANILEFARWIAGDADPDESRRVESGLSDPANPLSRALVRIDRAVASLPAVDGPTPSAIVSRDAATPSTKTEARAKSSRRAALWQAALVASVLLAVSAVLLREWGLRPLPPDPSASVAWGWMKPDAFPSEGSARDCYRRLAERLAEWDHVRPSTQAEMAQRVGELRHGCTLLQFAELRPLPLTARTELRDWCREWSQHLTDDLLDLESPQKSNVRAVYERSDARVREMLGFLKDRARDAEETS